MFILTHQSLSQSINIFLKMDTSRQLYPSVYRYVSLRYVILLMYNLKFCITFRNSIWLWLTKKGHFLMLNFCLNIWLMVSVTFSRTVLAHSHCSYTSRMFQLFLLCLFSQSYGIQEKKGNSSPEDSAKPIWWISIDASTYCICSHQKSLLGERSSADLYHAGERNYRTKRR